MCVSKSSYYSVKYIVMKINRPVKRLFLSVIAFFYTLSFIPALNTDIFIFDFLALFSPDGGVSGNAMFSLSLLLLAVLLIGVVLSVIYFYEIIRDSFPFIYLASILASVAILPFSTVGGGFISFSLPWYSTAILLLIFALYLSPATVFLVTYLVVTKNKSASPVRLI